MNEKEILMREGWEEIEHCLKGYNYFKKQYGYFTLYYYPIDNKLGIVLDYSDIDLEGLYIDDYNKTICFSEMMDVKDINSLEDDVQSLIDLFILKLHILINKITVNNNHRVE